MMKAIWNGQVIAESNDTIVVEGNHYFPKDSLDMQYFEPSQQTTMCSWKGEANYYSVSVDGKVNADAAWYYASPKPDAASIANRVAFWQGVEVLNE